MTTPSFVQDLEFADWEPPGAFDEETGVWYTNRTVENHFPTSGVEIFSAVDEHSFWFDHRNAMITKALDVHSPSGAILEVGSGSGVVAAHLAAAGRRVACVEPISGGAIYAARRGVSASFCGDLASLALPPGIVPAIGAFDVIEHLDEPNVVLDQCHRALRDDGVLILTVPAHQWLWSQFDEWNGHRRRYTRRTLAATVQESGFEVITSTYFFLPLLLPAMVSRLVVEKLRGRLKSTAEIEEQLSEGLAPDSAAVRWVLRSVHAIERAVYDKVPIPNGTSILMVCRKRSERLR